MGTAPFRRRTAIGAGLTDDDLRASGLARPFHGVYTQPDQTDVRARAVAYATKMLTDRAFTGLTAAALMGWPIPLRVEGRLDSTHVAAPRRASRIRGRGVIGTKIRDDLYQTLELDGLRLTSPPLTMLTLAATCTIPELVRFGDAAVATSTWYPGLRIRGATTPDALAQFAELARGCHGVERLRQALARVRPRVESPWETVLRLTIVDAGLPEPEVGGVIVEEGEQIAVCDLVYRDAKVVVEYEGEHHLVDADQARRDIERVRRLESHGWRVIRVTKTDLFPSSRQLMMQIARAIGADPAVLIAA